MSNQSIQQSGAYPLEMDEQQAQSDQQFLQSDPKAQVDLMDSVFSTKEASANSSSPKSLNKSEQITDLEQWMLDSNPALTLEKLRKQMKGLY